MAEDLVPLGGSWIAARLSDPSSLPTDYNILPHYTNFKPMDPKAQQQKTRDNILSMLNAAIETLNLAKEISSITPAKVVFGSVGVILTMIRVGFLLRCLC